ncbi:hypothetical protein HDU98_012009 [Podochytrium sp. JEL0797]|nr:hypothetical protein HDU98_012009 [Podochytrium sp. JEL0797]
MLQYNTSSTMHSDSDTSDTSFTPSLRKGSLGSPTPAIATLHIDSDTDEPFTTTSPTRVSAMASDLLSTTSYLHSGFMDDTTDLADVEFIDLSSPSSATLPFSLVCADPPTDKANLFTSQVRFSPLSADPSLKAMAHSLIILLKSIPLDPWEFADLVTDIDTAVHLHTRKDATWARDVLNIGVSLAKAATLSCPTLSSTKSTQSLDNADISNAFKRRDSTAVGMSVDLKNRMRDLIDFFRVIVCVGEQSCYRARKLIRCLQGGWYRNEEMEAMARRVCVEDRWWKKIQGRGVEIGV